jgi:glycosyltransferase involved in cell wall biosynthesis
LAVDAVGTRAESGGAIVLSDLLRAASTHPRIEHTSVFASAGTELGMPLVESRHSLQKVKVAGRAALAWWNTFGLERRAAEVGAQAIVSLNGMGRSRRIPLFMLFQQQLMFAPPALRRMDPVFRCRLAIMKKLARRACRCARLVFVQAFHVRHSILDQFGVAPESVCVIPPDISWTEREVVPAPREAGLVAYVGSARPHKSLDTLLAAFAQVRARRPDVQLALTVEPTAIPVQPGVVALGHLDRRLVRELLQRAEVLVMPSLAETVGLPLLEAMDLGCAIVAADLPYAREVSGASALYFEPRDATGCAAQMLGLLDSPAWRMRLADEARTILRRRRERKPYDELLDRLVSCLS